MDTEATPMFPLGTVLQPGVALPMQIFEPRYVQLLHDVLDADGTFGIVLIERGSEVGGGDSRFNVGTLARIIEHRPMPDGRHAIVVGGEHRIRVATWLADNPYPRAETNASPDEPPVDEFELVEAYASTVAMLRGFLARATEFGHRVSPSTFEIHDDPEPGSFLLAALLPNGPIDQQRLLEAPDALDRLAMIRSQIDELQMVVGP